MPRIGRGHREVDNISSGGICVNIGINRGTFGEFAMSYDGKKLAWHPDRILYFIVRRFHGGMTSKNLLWTLQVNCLF